jgi:outer membrane protein TolC
LESGKGQKLPVISQLETYKTQLSILIGNSADEIDLKQDAVLPNVDSLPLSVLTADLVQRRPDIQSAYLRIKAQDEKIAEALANKLPKLSLSATLATSDNRLKNLFDSFQSSIAGDIVMPLFDADRRELEVQRQYSLRLEASYAYVQAVHDAIKEVRDALVLEQNQALYIQSLEKQLKLSKQSVERVRQNYAKGRTDFLRLLSVQASDRQLELTYIAAKNDLLTYRINLYKALAGEIEG